MSKEELLELTGEVIEKLPNAMFRVRLENGVEILAHTAGKMRKFRIRVMVGDKVDIEMTEYVPYVAEQVVGNSFMVDGMNTIFRRAINK